MTHQTGARNAGQSGFSHTNSPALRLLEPTVMSDRGGRCAAVSSSGPSFGLLMLFPFEHGKASCSSPSPNSGVAYPEVMNARMVSVLRRPTSSWLASGTRW